MAVRAIKVKVMKGNNAALKVINGMAIKAKAMKEIVRGFEAVPNSVLTAVIAPLEIIHEEEMGTIDMAAMNMSGAAMGGMHHT